MGLRVVRLVMLCFMVIFLFGLYQTTLKLPSAEGESEGVLLYRTQSFQALKDRLNTEVLAKERELRDLIDSAVEVMVPKPEQQGGKGLRSPFSSHKSAADPPRAKRTSSGGSLASLVSRGGGDDGAIRMLKGKGHPILATSDEEFVGTPLDVFWSQYGRTGGEKNCEADFGYGLIKAWRGTNATFCSPHAHGDSRLQCYLMHQNHHHGGGDNLCLGSDVSLNFRELTDEAGVTRETMKRYINTRHSDAAWVHFKPGFMTATCEKRQNRWQQSAFPGWNEDLLFNGLKTIPGRGSKSMDETLGCDVWVEHPVLLLERDTFANFFHDSEDFVNTFLALAVLGWSIKDTQVYLLDLYPQGPFWDMWSRVFNGGHGPKMAWDLKNEFGKSNVCFKQVAVGIYGPAAPTTLASFKTECQHSTLVRAYSDTVIRGLGLQGLTHYAQATPSKVVTVTWMARRASVIWPERNFCGDDSFFKCEDFKHLEMRKLGRMVANDAEVVRALKHLESEVFENGAIVRFQDKDYNLLSFEEQIKVDLETDIMVGPHGAGLMHNVFMRDRAVLVELFIDGSGANKHFHNLAKWYGRRYVEMPSDNPVHTSQLYQQLRTLVQEMDLSKW